ncbi:hypothetical protein NQ317_007578 [Molorchus minor]|uniref:Estradiol 17-beta-dehydrogenase 2 n=1 Tax=Molorchus minor TaxID=1323400 RepID=A0ABQ9IQV4_9CUCU|nr:hypothetical protein NQ317_007578 [Molorchus minor]
MLNGNKMGTFSKALLTSFEIINELYTALGAGLLGMIVLLKHGFDSHQSIKTLSVVGLTTASWIFITRQTEKLKASKKESSCDSGLGFSLAQHATDMGFTVIAGFLSLDSKGSKEIRSLYGSNIIQIQLDVTSTSTLHAIINNAAVMVFGEFEWLTEKLIQEQVEVNLLGTFRFSNAFCPLLRQHKGRIITITSHCSQATLPGLSVYGATKAALTAWSDGIRVELKKYGVSVLTFIPGSFTIQSNIMGKQLQNVQEMHDNFTTEQHNFYSDYFKRYNVYLSFITPPTVPKKIEDSNIYNVFECTLLDKYPKVVYKNEQLRYAFYHLLFKFSPWCLRDYFVTHFMQMPEYTPPIDATVYDDDIDDIDL